MPLEYVTAYKHYGSQVSCQLLQEWVLIILHVNDGFGSGSQMSVLEWHGSGSAYHSNLCTPVLEGLPHFVLKQWVLLVQVASYKQEAISFLYAHNARIHQVFRSELLIQLMRIAQHINVMDVHSMQEVSEGTTCLYVHIISNDPTHLLRFE